MNAAHLAKFTSCLPNLVAYRILPILRRALFNRDLRVSPLTYQHLLRFAEQVATEGALFLLGRNDGLMVMTRYEALVSNGFEDLARVADALATLMAATVQNDRRQAATSGAVLAARDEHTKHNAQEICRALIPVRGSVRRPVMGKVLPLRRAA